MKIQKIESVKIMVDDERYMLVTFDSEAKFGEVWTGFEMYGVMEHEFGVNAGSLDSMIELAVSNYESGNIVWIAPED